MDVIHGPLEGFPVMPAGVHLDGSCDLQVWRRTFSGDAVDSSAIFELRTPADAQQLSLLEALLKQLPFADGSLKLGPTWQEMGKQETFVSDCSGGSTVVVWKGRALIVQDADGMPGDGKTISDLWLQFEQAMGQRDLRSFPDLHEKSSQESEKILQVTKHGAAGKRVVLTLNLPEDQVLLAEVEPLLRELPFADASLKLGPSLTEMTSSSFSVSQEEVLIELCWGKRVLFVQGADGCPGDGIGPTKVWHEFEGKLLPFYCKES